MLARMPSQLRTTCRATSATARLDSGLSPRRRQRPAASSAASQISCGAGVGLQPEPGRGRPAVAAEQPLGLLQHFLGQLDGPGAQRGEQPQLGELVRPREDPLHLGRQRCGVRLAARG